MFANPPARAFFSVDDGERLLYYHWVRFPGLASTL